MPTIIGTAPNAPPADFASVLDDAMRRIVGRLEAIGQEQKELEMSLMSLKELRASVGHLPETAMRAILIALRQQAVVPTPRRAEAMATVWGAVVTDDEDGPACAEPLSPAESLTNYEKMVNFFVARKNQPATNQDIRAAIGASRGAVAQILYTSHADKVERSKARIAGKVAWQLRDSVYRAELGKRDSTEEKLQMELKAAGRGGWTGEPSPVSGVFRSDHVEETELSIAQGHIFPPCSECGRKAFWTLVRRANVKPAK